MRTEERPLFLKSRVSWVRSPHGLPINSSIYKQASDRRARRGCTGVAGHRWQEPKVRAAQNGL